MKYIGMPLGMWLLYKRSFRAHLQSVLGCTRQAANAITKQAKPKYKAIIARVPDFEKQDRFKMNLVNCALLTAFVRSMETRPTVEALTQFYGKAMMNAPTRWFCRLSGKQKFSKKRRPRHGTDGRAAGGGPQRVFLEHGLSAVSRRQRL